MTPSFDNLLVEEKGVDLHVHSTAADGSFTPAEAVEYAASIELEAVAICDHDTMAGIEAGAGAAHKAGIEFVPGIELSCPWRGAEHHLLGYYCDPDEAGFRDLLENCRIERKARMAATVGIFRDLGYDIPLEILDRKNSMIDRGDIVWELINQGLEKDFSSAYPRHFWMDKKGYILPYSVGKAKPLTLQRAIEAIHRAGGVASLAHPVGFYVKEMPAEQVKEAAEWGLDGLEVFTPRHSPEQMRYLYGLVEEFGLIATGGTDCHGKVKDTPKMGMMRIHHSILDTLKARRK